MMMMAPAPDMLDSDSTLLSGDEATANRHTWPFFFWKGEAADLFLFSLSGYWNSKRTII
jgi:hypothetical protein